MEEMLKADFIEVVVTHYDYTEEKAEAMWNEHGEKYCSGVYERMSDLVQEIIEG